MSENPVRSASVKAAKRIDAGPNWALDGGSLWVGDVADIIESKFARVIAAAEEAMKEKCAVVCDERAKSTFNRNTAIESQICATKIRAIPTGTALAEHVANAVEKAQVDAAVEFHRMEKGKVERATAELRAELMNAVSQAKGWEREIANLKAQLAERVREAVEAEREACAVACEDELRKIAAAEVEGRAMSKLTAGEVYGFTMPAKLIRARKDGGQ